MVRKILLIFASIFLITSCTHKNMNYQITNQEFTEFSIDLFDKINTWRNNEIFFKENNVITPKELTKDEAWSIGKNVYETVEYKKEPTGCDYWQTPEETERLKTGDCEDRSGLIYRNLIKAGTADWMLYRIQSGCNKRIQHYDTGIILENDLYVITKSGIYRLNEWFPYYKSGCGTVEPLGAINLYGYWIVESVSK